MSDVSEEIREMSIQPPLKCSFCQATRAQHRELEASGEVHHQFSERGELSHIKPEAKRPRAVVAAPDLVLRMALIDAGIITEGQLTLAEAKIRDSLSSGGRGGVPEDSGDRPPQGS